MVASISDPFDGDAVTAASATVTILDDDASVPAALFWRDDFEGLGPSLGGGDRSAGAHADADDGTCPAADPEGNYFFRTDETGASAFDGGLTLTVSNVEDSSYWRGEDVEDSGRGGTPDPALDVLDSTGIDIAGRTNAAFSGLFGGGAENRFVAIEPDDLMRVSYAIDGGPYVTALQFIGDGVADGSFVLDADRDGVVDPGETTRLSAALSEHGFVVTGTGSTLALKVETNVGASEEVTFDDFRLVGAGAPLAGGVNAGWGALEGGRRAITRDDLRASAPNAGPEGIVYTVTEGVEHGELRLGAGDGAPLGADGTFTQADLDAGSLAYVHDGGETRSDGFGFEVSDGVATVGGGRFDIVVAAVNDAPRITSDLSGEVGRGAPVALTAADLGAFDPDDGAETLAFCVTETASGRMEATAAGSAAVTLAVVNAALVVAEPLGDVISAEDAPVAFALPADVFDDPNGDALNLTAALEDGSALPSWLGFDGAALARLPPAHFNGALRIDVTASDGALTASDVFALAITPVNDAPVLTSPAAFSTPDDATGAFPVAATDVDGDAPLTYSTEGGADAGLFVLDGATGTLAFRRAGLRGVGGRRPRQRLRADGRRIRRRRHHPSRGARDRHRRGRRPPEPDRRHGGVGRAARNRGRRRDRAARRAPRRHARRRRGPRLRVRRRDVQRPPRDRPDPRLRRGRGRPDRARRASRCESSATPGAVRWWSSRATAICSTPAAWTPAGQAR